MKIYGGLDSLTKLEIQWRFLGLEEFRSLATAWQMIVDWWKYAGATPRQSRRILISYEWYERDLCEYFSLSPSFSPFFRQIAKRARKVIFLF